jgi:hypothetical protein
MTRLTISPPIWRSEYNNSYWHFASHVRGLSSPAPQYNLEGGVWVDASIAQLIVDLNELGYPTQFCCSGLPSEHRGHDPMLGGYVSFAGDVPKSSVPDYFSIENAAKGWRCVRTPNPSRHAIREVEMAAAWAEWAVAVSEALKGVAA